jgi:hypothetical protein
MSDAYANTVWTIKGSGWVYSLKAPSSSDPVEIATRVIELLFSEEIEGEDVWLGMLVGVSKSEGSDAAEDLMIPTPLLLANAGRHSQAIAIGEAWEGMSEEERLSHLAIVLSGEAD